MSVPDPDPIDRGLVLRLAWDLAAGMSFHDAAIRVSEGDPMLDVDTFGSREFAERAGRVQRDHGFYDLSLTQDPVELRWVAYGRHEGEEVEVKSYDRDTAASEYLRVIGALGGSAWRVSHEFEVRMGSEPVFTVRPGDRWERLAALAELDEPPLDPTQVRVEIDDLVQQLRHFVATESLSELMRVREALANVVFHSPQWRGDITTDTPDLEEDAT